MDSRTRRGVGCAVTIGSVVAVLTAPATAAVAAEAVVAVTAAPACRVEALPLPMQARESAVTAGDPRGQWLGGYLLDGPDGEALAEALLWRNGVLVPFEPDLYSVTVKGINRHGVVVGGGYDESGHSVPFAYVDGVTVLLAEPAGSSYTAVTGVSAEGTIVGFALGVDGATDAVTWSLEQPDVVTALPVPARAESSKAQGISGRGTIAIEARMPDRSRLFVLNRHGKRTELHGVADGSSLEARAVSNGWLTAYERDGFGHENAYFVRFDLRDDTVEQVPIGSTVNPHGTIGGQFGEDAALYTDELTLLPTLADVPNGASVAVVDRNGQPAGQAGASAADASVAVRWRCG